MTSHLQHNSASDGSMSTGTAAPALRVDSLVKRFGGLVVADDITFELQPGETKCLIGPNGAGKSTFVNLVTGFAVPDAGSVHLDGEDITSLGTSKRRQLGIARTFQTARVLEEASLFANVLLALRFRTRPSALMRRSRSSAEERERVDWALSQVGLHARADAVSGSLPHGQKRLLEIAMALADTPKVLLLDEPAAGMSSRETEEVAQVIRSVRGGIATLVIDHDMTFIRQLDTAVAVLHRGALVRQGRIDDLQSDPFVQEIYLGVPDHD